jgi:hypothetical protein
MIPGHYQFILVPIDPKLREQCHGEINHLFGLQDNDRFALETSTPVTLPTGIPFDLMGRRFAPACPVG